MGAQSYDLLRAKPALWLTGIQQVPSYSLPCALCRLGTFAKLSSLGPEFAAAVQAAAASAGQASANGAAAPEDVDLAADRHRGQFALRKLYHESERLVVVLYTSPSCGPCRTLKPIFSKVADEFTGKVRPAASPAYMDDGRGQGCRCSCYK